MGKKYIIELESGTHMFVLGPEGIVHIGEPDVVYETVDGMQIGDVVINAKPYTEPDLDAIRNETWEAARKIGSNSMYGLKEMGFDFSQCVVNDYNPSWFVIKNYSASECIEKIRQYEQKQDRRARIEYNCEEIKDVINTTMRECNVSLDEIAEVLRKMREVNNG